MECIKMLLIEIDNHIINLSNASVIDFTKNTMNVHYNNDTIIHMANSPQLDTLAFNEYFFKFETTDKTIYFNKHNFLYVKKIEETKLSFNFFENFSYILETSYDELLRQLG